MSSSAKVWIIVGIIFIIGAVVAYFILKSMASGSGAHSSGGYQTVNVGGIPVTPASQGWFDAKAGDKILSHSTRNTMIVNGAGWRVYTAHQKDTLLGYYMGQTNVNDMPNGSNFISAGGFTGAAGSDNKSVIALSTQPNLQGGDVIYVGWGSDLYKA